jgi:hypothetical protein
MLVHKTLMTVGDDSGHVMQAETSDMLCQVWERMSWVLPIRKVACGELDWNWAPSTDMSSTRNFGVGIEDIGRIMVCINIWYWVLRNLVRP